MKFSYYNSGITQKVPDKSIEIKEAARLIYKDETLKSKTVTLRNIQDKEKKGKFKASLPYIRYIHLTCKRKPY